jgi:hypothetical protein
MMKGFRFTAVLAELFAVVAGTSSYANTMKKTVLSIVLYLLFSISASGAERPNIVFILTDDQNYDTIGCFGGQVLTPAMDRLAGEGVRFTQAFTVHGICTPSR